MADQNIWFPTNKAKAIIDYMPGYPIFIMFSNFLNFSLRISHEIFYTLSNILLVFSFRLLKIPRYICLVIFAILTFHITTFLWFNTILTETIAISLYHILLALTVNIWRFLSIIFDLERTNGLNLLPDKDLVDLCPPIEPYQVTKSH